MKFSVSKDRILDELQNLQGIVEKRNTMPILANILLNVTESEIELTGTDLEVGMRTHFSADVKETGSVTVSGKKLFEIVKSLPDEQDVEFKQNDDMMMEVTSGESEFKVLCLPKDDYPAVPDAKFEKNIHIPVEELRLMIDRVLFAIAQEQRYYLNGALLVVKPKGLEMVSTDGHRLSYVSKKADIPDVGDPIKVIVAKKTLNEIKKFEEGSVDFDMDENNLFFRCGHRTLISRIIESKFPNFEAVIPKDNPHVVMLDKEAFTGAIRRVSLLSAERSKGVKFTVEKNHMRLFSSNPEMGEARDRIDIDYKGPKIEIGFNGQYFLDFLSVTASEKIKFELKDENSAALLRPEGEKEIDSQYVLMPMKI